MSDEENYSDVKTEDEEAQPMMVKPTGLKPAIKPAGGLWKKVGGQLLPCKYFHILKFISNELLDLSLRSGLCWKIMIFSLFLVK